MKNAKGHCLSCKFYRLENAESGVCRVDKELTTNYPRKDTDDQCLRWRDSGQQYFIRIGWIRAKKAADGESEAIGKK